MKTPKIVGLLGAAWLALLGAAGWTPALAQDALKLLPTGGEGVTTNLSPQLLDQPYTARLGDLRLLASATMETVWNDNILLTDSSREQDFILRPTANLQAIYPLTEFNSINFHMGIGYEEYLQHQNDSRLLITPGSVLSFNFKAEEFRINIHDRVSYENDPSIYGNISGIVRLGGLANDAGIAVSRDVGALALTAGYDHLNFISSLAAFDSLNNSADDVMARAVVRIRPGAFIGLEGSESSTVYSESILSGYTCYAGGLYTEWQVTPRMVVTGRAGALDYEYYRPALTQGHSSIPGYYATVSAVGTLNPYFTYTLEGGHAVTVSVDGALLQQWYVSFSSAYEIIRNGSLVASVRYENVSEPFENAFENGAYFASHFTRVAPRLAFTYALSKHWDASLAYTLIIKDASSGIADYTQNTVTLGLTYHF